MGKKEKSLNQKLAEINGMWDRCEFYVVNMPDREMFDCDNPDHEELLEYIYLDDNPDWTAWELELMD